MGRVGVDWTDIPLARKMDTLHLDLTAGPVADPAACSVGNPHATFFVPDLVGLPIAEIGPVLEHDKLFPDRANIGFVQMLAPDRLALRVWERGAGLTLACGSGACAALERLPAETSWFRCAIAPAQLGDRAGVIGAALAALERVA